MKAILPDQTVINYNIIGKGMPLVLLHGNLQSSKAFELNNTIHNFIIKTTSMS